MEKVNLLIKTVIFILENGEMINIMEKEFFKQKNVNMKDNGRMIYNMDLEKKNGMIIAFMKAIFMKGKNKEKEHLNGRMEQFIQVCGLTTKDMEKEHKIG